jgi:hypothetical protein
MKSELDPGTTPAQKMDRFRTALKSVLAVSHDELKEALAKDEKTRRQLKNKPGPRPQNA